MCLLHSVTAVKFDTYAVW